MVDKVYSSPDEALAGLTQDGMTGGRGVRAVRHTREADHRLADTGVGSITRSATMPESMTGARPARTADPKMVSSYVGENDLFKQQFMSGELELEFNPCGPWQRLRGRHSLFTKTGVGTVIAENKGTRSSTGDLPDGTGHPGRPRAGQGLKGDAFEPRVQEDRPQLQPDGGHHGETVAEVENWWALESWIPTKYTPRASSWTGSSDRVREADRESTPG